MLILKVIEQGYTPVLAAYEEFELGAGHQGEGGGTPGPGASLYKQEVHGRRHCGAGTMTVSRKGQGLLSQVGAQGCGRPGRNSWGPDSLTPGPGEELPLSWLSPRRKFPTDSREALPIPRPRLCLNLLFLLQGHVVFRANLGYRPPPEVPWAGGLEGGGQARPGSDANLGGAATYETCAKGKA